MPVITIPFGDFQANCHIVHNGRDAVVFDPADDTAAVMKALKDAGLELRAVALTHLHIDHCLGCAGLAAASGMKPLVGRADWEDRRRLLCKGMTFGIPLEPFEAEPLDEGDVSWGSLACRVMATPGHSTGSMSYYFKDLGLVVTGDLLFYRSVGRSDFPGGDGDELKRSIRGKIYALPSDTAVYPGHGPETSVGYEAANNAFCRAAV